MKLKALALVVALASYCASATVPGDVKFYINPGHGGYDSDDRNVVIAPFTQGDPAGFWESKSNLIKGLYLRDMLQERGYKVAISRTTNTSADDLNLDVIDALANQFGATLFLSIHSNATGTGTRCNYPMMFYRGYTGEPVYAKSLTFAEITDTKLRNNKAAVWTRETPYITGDWTFYPNWGDKVGLGVLRYLTRPGILSEGSFHDYIPEAYRLMSEDFCWCEAYHFLKAIEEFYSIESQETTGHVGGVVYDNRFLRDESYIMFDRDNNLPLTEATVELLSMDDQVLSTYKTSYLPNGFFLFKDVAPGSYKVRVSKDTHETTVAEVTVEKNRVNYVNVPVKKLRNTPPELVSHTPNWTEGDAPIMCNTPLVMTFNWDMDPESTEKAFKLYPHVDGKFQWSESNFVMTFTPNDPFVANTLYTVTIDKSAMHAGDVPMTEDASFQFMTDARSYYTMINNYPTDGSVMHITSPTVYMNFDAEVSSPTAYNNVKVYDENGTALTFNSRSISAGKNPFMGWIKLPLSKALTEGKEYTLVIPNTVSDVNGIHLEKEQTIKFTAENLAKQKEGAVILNGFNDISTCTFGAPAIIKTTNTIDKSGKLIGTGCLQVKYTIDEPLEGDIQITPTLAETVTTKDLLELSIFGDLSEAVVSLKLSGNGSTFTVPVGKIDFYGWKTLKIDLSQYGDPEDSTEYDTAVLTVGLKPDVPLLSSTIKFDNLVRFPGQGGVEATLADKTAVKILYEQGSDYAVATGDAVVMKIEVFDLGGKLVASRAGNVVNISHLAPNVYVVRATTAAGPAVAKINISK